MDTRRVNLLQGAGLGCVAGYVDTLGFMALFGLFTAHVTGNFVLIGVSLADAAHATILLKFLAFPAFIVGIAAGRLLSVAAASRAWPALTLALLLQALLLSGFLVCGVLATPIGATASPAAMAAGLFGATAMGVHSATSRLLLGHLAPTSMMTGNVTQVVIDSVDVLRGAGDAGTSERCSKFFWPLAAFGCGAIAAAFAYRSAGFMALLLPIAILLGLVALDRNTPAKAPGKA